MDALVCDKLTVEEHSRLIHAFKVTSGLHSLVCDTGKDEPMTWDLGL